MIIGCCLCPVLCLRLEAKSDTEQNTTESPVSETTTEEDYDFAEDDNSKGFVDKLRELHQKNGNNTVVYRSKDFNETFDTIEKFRQNFKYLFKTDDKLAIELLEFVSELDIKLTSGCSSALFRIYSAVRNSEIWGLRCK